MVLESAETVFVLALRSNGNVHRLLRERLQRPRAATVLVDLPGLQAESARSELVEIGATIWQPSAASCLPFETLSNPAHETAHNLVAEPHVYEVAPFPLTDDWHMLTHTTRSLLPGPNGLANQV